MPQVNIWRNSNARISSVSLIILLVVSALTTLGLLVLFSASKAYYDNPSLIVQKQFIWLLLSVFSAFVIFRLNLERLRDFTFILGGFSLLLLFLVLIPGIGVEVNGARRWIDFGVMRLQVSEIGKIGLLFTLSHYLALHRRSLDQMMGGFIIPCSILGVFCALIFLEPDFGTAFLCGLVGGILFFCIGNALEVFVSNVVFCLSCFHHCYH